MNEINHSAAIEFLEKDPAAIALGESGQILNRSDADSVTGSALDVRYRNQL
jgi:hypothetical protein